MRILLVEDDLALGAGIQKAISRDGNAVEWLTRGDLAIDAIIAEDFELVILDLGLPGTDGINVLKAVRRGGNATPILVLTARDTLDDRVSGLDAGADDYLIKPFELEELKARMRALSRRNHGQVETVVTVGELTLNTASMRVSVSGDTVDLSRREYALLLELVNHKGRVLTRDRLETVLYGWDGELESNALEVHIHHLRKKLPPQMIKTVRGVGYRLEEHE
jgi:two-component system response regulator QseB